MKNTLYAVDTRDYTVVPEPVGKSQIEKFMQRYSDTTVAPRNPVIIDPVQPRLVKIDRTTHTRQSMLGNQEKTVNSGSSADKSIVDENKNDNGGMVLPEKPNEKDRSLQLITPERAKDLLSRNFRNRKVTRGYVKQLAKSMAEGVWYAETSECIHVSPTGKLLNGQHRLLAIIESGTVGQWVWFQKNVSKEAAVYIDSGRKRSTSDALYMGSGINWFNTSLSSMMRCAVVSAPEVQGDIQRMQRFTEKYEKELKDTLEFFKPKVMVPFKHRIFVAAIFLALCNGVTLEQLLQYRQSFERGYDPNPQGCTSAALAQIFRKMKEKKAVLDTKMSEADLMNKCQHNIQLYIKGKCVDKVCASKELYWQKLIIE